MPANLSCHNRDTKQSYLGVRFAFPEQWKEISTSSGMKIDLTCFVVFLPILGTLWRRLVLLSWTCLYSETGKERDITTYRQPIELINFNSVHYKTKGGGGLSET